VRYASDEPYPAHANGLWLDVDPVVARPDAPLILRARSRDEDAGEIATALRARIESAGKVVTEAPMVALQSPGRFELTLPQLPGVGSYNVIVFDPAHPERHVACPLRVEALSSEQELADISGNDRLLRTIADATGGRYVPLTQIATLNNELLRLRQEQSALVEYTLWDSPYLFVLVLSCFGAEWALRKRFGLA
jgi:hypothetical protein